MPDSIRHPFAERVSLEMDSESRYACPERHPITPTLPSPVKGEGIINCYCYHFWKLMAVYASSSPRYALMTSG